MISIFEVLPFLLEKKAVQAMPSRNVTYKSQPTHLDVKTLLPPIILSHATRLHVIHFSYPKLPHIPLFLYRLPLVPYVLNCIAVREGTNSVQACSVPAVICNSQMERKKQCTSQKQAYVTYI